MSIELEFPDWTPPQRRIASSTKQFNVLAWGRQTGKTTFATDKMLYKPLQGPVEGVYWHILQTYSAAEIVFNRYWRKLQHFAPKLLDGKPNESERRVRLPNGVDVFFKSGANFEDLRTETLNGCIIDEMRQQSPFLWPRIIYPMASRFDAWVDFQSTPNGFDHFYDIAEFAKAYPESWGYFHAPCTEAWWWTPKKIAEAKQVMTESEFKQEILAEFCDMTSGRAYTNYSERNDRTDSPFAPGKEYSEFLPVWVSMDFNLSPMAWTLGQNKGLDFHASEEIWLPYISDPFEPARNLIHRLKALPFDVNKLGVHIVGDASGKATQRTSMQSDYDIVFQALDRANIRYVNRTPDSNPSIKDRVNTFNARLRDANGDIHFTLNPQKCPQAKRDLLRTKWKESSQIPALDPGPQRDLGHSSDGLGYWISLLAPLHKGVPASTLKVLIR